MKSLVLALLVAISAALLHSGSAEPDAGIQVVASYEGYDMRKFPEKPLLLCTAIRGPGLSGLGQAEKNVLDAVEQQAKKGQPIPIGTPTIIQKPIRGKVGRYCKFVSGDYKGPFPTLGAGEELVRFAPRKFQFAFYAMKADNNEEGAILAAGKKMLQVIRAEKNPKAIRRGSMFVEYAASGEVFVGPLDLTSVSE